MPNTKVIILGGGFAGLTAAKTLANSSLDVWLIDKTNHHLFQPLLYEVATAALSPDDIALPIRELLAHEKNITVMMGEVVSIDKNKRIVSLQNNEFLGFDYLIIALGAQTNYHHHNEYEKFAPGLKTLTDALKIREKILISFERHARAQSHLFRGGLAELSTFSGAEERPPLAEEDSPPFQGEDLQKAERSENRKKAEQYLNFVIVGGGPRGVEMAGAIAEIANKTMIRNFRHIDPAAIKIYLIERLPRILSSFPEPLSRKAQSYLEKLNVCVMTNAQLSEVTEQGVRVGETFIPSQNLFWLAGDEASPILKTLGVPLDRQGRVIVDSDLSISGYPEIFVIGDAACVQDSNGAVLPALAPVAIQQGRYVGCNIKNHLGKNERKPFHYSNYGILTSIRKTKAVGQIKNVQVSGFFAWIIWGLVHLFYLPSMANRFFVLSKWLCSFFTAKRGARLIYRSIDEQ